MDAEWQAIHYSDSSVALRLRGSIRALLAPWTRKNFFVDNILFARRAPLEPNGWIKSCMDSWLLRHRNGVICHDITDI